MPFINGSTHEPYIKEEDDSDASDEEVYNRRFAKQRQEEERQFVEAERKWVNRERSKSGGGLIGRRPGNDPRTTTPRDEHRTSWRAKRPGGRRQGGEHQEAPILPRSFQLGPQSHAGSGWPRRQARWRLDRRAEEDDERRRQYEMDQARGAADSFLDRELSRPDNHASAAPRAL